MPRRQTQKRIEWLPGPAAQEALQILLALHPGRSQQELIDLALIRSAWTDRYPAPQMPGPDRMRWVLPAALHLQRVGVAPELLPQTSQSNAHESSGTPCSHIAAQLIMQAIAED